MSDRRKLSERYRDSVHMDEWALNEIIALEATIAERDKKLADLAVELSGAFKVKYLELDERTIWGYDTGTVRIVINKLEALAAAESSLREDLR